MENEKGDSLYAKKRRCASLILDMIIKYSKGAEKGREKEKRDG